jgi:MFS transporter, FLVCR family, feline leukemia virus subgroup C receptor-related protein
LVSLLILQGLRVAAILGAFGTCLGAWIKVFSVQPDLFWVGFIGQSIVATAQVNIKQTKIAYAEVFDINSYYFCFQVFILSLPAKVAAVWFGPDQVSSACSIGVFGNQVSFNNIRNIGRINQCLGGL